ncbi:Agenet domain-containing protein [Prunus dulcis]|uniref:Agenet domain-containing protein n=1 Tax=Prunus dulcis TaxID=3755 RepID=A0A4Y1RDI2_PRUDU|nr:Agenet domain-containing protein [Prunus dulcis]
MAPLRVRNTAARSRLFSSSGKRKPLLEERLDIAWIRFEGQRDTSAFGILKLSKNHQQEAHAKWESWGYENMGGLRELDEMGVGCYRRSKGLKLLRWQLHHHYFQLHSKGSCRFKIQICATKSSIADIQTLSVNNPVTPTQST